MTGTMTVSEVGQIFFDQPEVQNKYYSLDTESFVESVYQNVLGREAETEGKDYGIEELNNDVFKNSQFIEAINNGAIGDDALRLANLKNVGYY